MISLFAFLATSTAQETALSGLFFIWRTRFLVFFIKKELEEAGLRIRVAENPREK